MSKQKLKHIRSGVENKKPTPEQIDLGVIAVNFNTNNPFLSIKDSNDEIVSFPSEKGIETIVETEVNEVAPTIIQEILPTVIGEDYYTKQETDAEINALSAATDTKLEQKANVSDIPSLDGYATEDWVQGQGYLTEHQSLDDYYTKEQTSGATEIAQALEGKANVGDIPSLDGYATEQWVTDQHYLTEHQDISGLATKQEVEDGLAGKSNTGHTHTVSDITNFPSIPTSTSDLTNDSDFITSGYTYSKAESDEKYALKGDVPTDVYTKQETDEAISGATQDMATMTWVGEQGYLTEHQSLDNYYTKEQVDNEISGATEGLASEQWVQNQGYLTEHQSLDNYYTKEQVDSAVSGATQDMATETWVQNQGYLTEHQDISNLATKQEVNDLSGATDTKLALKADLTDIPDVSNYFDDAQYDSNTKRINFYHGETIKAYVDATDFIKDGMVDNVDIETLSGSTYLVITFNTESGKEPINIPIADIFNAANYYTKSEVDNAITGATQDMATQTWVTSQGYLTQHQDISNLATKQEVETLSGATDTKLAGKQDTLVAGEGISISGNTISATGGGGGEYTAGRNMEITSGGTINCTIPVNTGSYNDYRSDLSFGTGINLGSDYSRIGIGRNINFGSGSRTSRSIAICPSHNNSSLKTNIYGSYAIAIGDETQIGTADSPSDVANSAVAIGSKAKAKKSSSVALGPYTETNAEHSVAIGHYNLANAEYGFNCGKFNIGQTDTLFELGNGTAYNSRSNAVEVKNNGDIYIMLDGQMVKLQDHLGGGGSITIDPALDPTSPNAVANSAITESLSAKFDASGITDYYTSTEVDNAISAATSTKQDTLIAGEGISISGNTISATGGGGGGGMTEDTELLLATAITDLNDRKIDAKEVNARFQKKGSYVTTSALNTRLADYETALDEQNIEEVAAYALNDLNSRKQDKLIPGEGISISGNTISATGGGGGTTYTAGDGISISGTTISAVPDASITSGSTNSVQSAAIYTQFDGMQLKKITQSDYDLLPTKDSNTLYIITNSN